MADDPFINVLYGIGVGGGNNIIKIEIAENKQCQAKSATKALPKSEKSNTSRNKEWNRENN